MGQPLLFTVALGLVSPWNVTEVTFDPDQGRIDIQVAFARGARFACPSCVATEQPVHDTREREDLSSVQRVCPATDSGDRTSEYW